MPFREIIKEEIGENKKVVISQRDDGRISIAQQVLVESDGKTMEFFLKNAIIVNLEGLEIMIKALTDAKEFLEN
jgi:hypothetical protein